MNSKALLALLVAVLAIDQASASNRSGVKKGDGGDKFTIEHFAVPHPSKHIVQGKGSQGVFSSSSDTGYQKKERSCETRDSLPPTTPAVQLLKMAKSALNGPTLDARTAIIGQLDNEITRHIRDITELFIETRDTLARCSVDINQMSPKKAAEILFAKVEPDAPAPRKLVEEGENRPIQDMSFSSSSPLPLSECIRAESSSSRIVLSSGETISSVRTSLGRFVEVNSPLVAAIKSIMADSRFFSAYYKNRATSEIAGAAEFCVDMADSMAKMQKIAALLEADPFAASISTLGKAVNDIAPISEQVETKMKVTDTLESERDHINAMTFLPTQIERAVKIAKGAIESAMEVVPTALLAKPPKDMEECEKESDSVVASASRRQLSSGKRRDSRALTHSSTSQRRQSSFSSVPDSVRNAPISQCDSMPSASLKTGNGGGMPEEEEDTSVSVAPPTDLRPKCHAETVRTFVNDLKDLYGQLAWLLKLNSTAEAYTMRMIEEDKRVFGIRFSHGMSRFEQVRNEIIELLSYIPETTEGRHIKPEMESGHYASYIQVPHSVQGSADEGKR